MADKKKRKKKKILPKIIIGIVVTLLGALLLVALVYGGNIHKLKKNAQKITRNVTEDTFKQIQTSVVYDINGNEITSLSGEKDLYYIDGDRIPDILKNTFILLEDRDFYKHKGVDMSAIIRAVIANAKSNSISQGASTITQQLAKNMFLTQDVTWERKITEMFVAMELEKKFDKDQILEFYINNIYFAHGYYGIEAAAEGYFGKDVEELSLSQLAFLAAIPKNPSKYDPVDNFDKTIERRDYILKQLYADGQITSLEYYKAIEETITLVDTKKNRENYVDTYVFYCATRALMEKNGFVFQDNFETPEDEEAYNEKYDEWYSHYQATLFTGGDRIYTAIDMDKQKLLQDILDEKLEKFTAVNDEGIYQTQGAAVCIDNSTGLVTAIVGGRSQDYDGYTLNRAYQSYRQPGSSIKPVNVYAPYMMQGHTPDEIISDEPIQGGPANDGDVYRGDITLTDALIWSTNVCAWQVMEAITPSYANGFLRLMNFQKAAYDQDNIATSIGGFTYGVSPVEMASAYATLENDGVYRNPSCISKITDSSGNIIVDSTGKETAVYSEYAARTVTKMLEKGVHEGIVTRAALDNAIVAAKSGTTNDNKDGWLVGYSKYYTTSVWVGNDMPATVDGLVGSSYPLDIWHDFMYEIHKGKKRIAFPDYEGQTNVDETESGETSGAQVQPETRPGYGDNTLNISDGDHKVNVQGDGDVDVDLSQYR